MKVSQMITDKISKENQIVSMFREHGALSVELAKDIKSIGEVNKQAFNKLYGKGVLASGGGDTFFLDEQMLMKYRMERVKWGIILMFIILIIIVFITGA